MPIVNAWKSLKQIIHAVLPILEPKISQSKPLPSQYVHFLETVKEYCACYDGQGTRKKNQEQLCYDSIWYTYTELHYGNFQTEISYLLVYYQ